VLVVVSKWKMTSSSCVKIVRNNKTVKNQTLTDMTMRKMTMSETIKHHLGDDWIMIFNVDDYYYLIEDFLEVEEEEEDY
jgi:hypothetical protein